MAPSSSGQLSIRSVGASGEAEKEADDVAQHLWTEQDDLIALYVYQHGEGGLPLPLDAILRARGIGRGSFRMRVANFRAIATGAGLSNAAKQSREIFARYSRISEVELRKKALDVG